MKTTSSKYWIAIGAIGGIALLSPIYVGLVLADSKRVYRELADGYREPFRGLDKRASAVLAGAKADGGGDWGWHRWAHGRSGLTFRGRSVAATPDGLILQVDVADPARGDAGCLIAFPDEVYIVAFYPEPCSERRTQAVFQPVH